MTTIDVVAAGTKLLNLTGDILTGAGVELPARTGFLPGALISYDAEQFVINAIGITAGIVGGGDTPERMVVGTVVQFFYEFEMALIRSTPTLARGGAIPSMKSLAASAQSTANDAEQILSAMVQIQTEFLIVPQRIPFSYGPISFLGPEGAMVGVRCPVSFQVGQAADGTY